MFLLAISVFAFVIFIFSILVNDFLLRYLKELGTQNHVGEERWSVTRKPAIGGITFFICFLLSSISLVYTIPRSDFFQFEQFYGLMLALSVGFLAGLFDDAYNTIPWLKLLMQIICGLSLALTGTYIDLFDVQIYNVVLTVFWVVGIMNAVNLLDNMDGISTIVSFFIILAFVLSVFVLDTITDNYFLILIGVAVSLLAFLRYNWWPSKMYMGDTGSMFLGVTIAAFGVIHVWNLQVLPGELAPASARVLAVACLFALPLIDTTTVFFKRVFRDRKSPFKGGKDHTTHHLSYLGLNDKQVAWVFIGISFMNTIFALSIIMVAGRWNSFHILAFGSWFVLLFGFLFVIANVNTKRDETN
jgi:UDP-GlcNAc:undecaprenyl-phosphate/decaprenyl-phosphate GlcNAc-1-phosphate transferase